MEDEVAVMLLDEVAGLDSRVGVLSTVVTDAAVLVNVLLVSEEGAAMADDEAGPIATLLVITEL